MFPGYICQEKLQYTILPTVSTSYQHSLHVKIVCCPQIEPSFNVTCLAANYQEKKKKVNVTSKAELINKWNGQGREGDEF